MRTIILTIAFLSVASVCSAAGTVIISGPVAVTIDDTISVSLGGATIVTRADPYDFDTFGYGQFIDSTAVVQFQSAFDLIYVTSDTDCSIQVGFAVVEAPTNTFDGDFLQAGGLIIYPRRASTVRAITRSGRFAPQFAIRVRGMR